MNIANLKTRSTQRLRAAGIDTPDLDARLLMMHGLKWDASDLIIRSHEEVPEEDLQNIDSFINRRMHGEPIDHIIGYREFYGRRFRVTKVVLTPRPETEGLVDQALKAIKGVDFPQILDLGTGSGAILISILAEAENAMGAGADISETALKIASANAEAHNVNEHVSFIQSHWLENISDRYDLIISNPPYITDAAMADLSVEVKKFDPDMALRGGKDGLMHYREIISSANQYLKPKGSLLLEIGYDQGQAVLGLMRQADFQDLELLKDLAGHDRIVAGRNN